MTGHCPARTYLRPVPLMLRLSMHTTIGFLVCHRGIVTNSCRVYGNASGRCGCICRTLTRIDTHNRSSSTSTLSLPDNGCVHVCASQSWQKESTRRSREEPVMTSLRLFHHWSELCKLRSWPGLILGSCGLSREARLSTGPQEGTDSVDTRRREDQNA